MSRRVSDFDAKAAALNLLTTTISQINNLKSIEIEEAAEQLTSYDTDGCSDVIDREIWKHIRAETQTNIQGIIKSKLRPNGVDDDLWAELSVEDRNDIICNIGKIGAEPENPDEIDITTWNKLSPGTKTSIIDKMYMLRPKGFDSTLWDSLNDVTKHHITKDIDAYSKRSRAEKQLEYKLNSRGCISWELHRWMTREAHKRGPIPQKYYARFWVQRFTVNSRVLNFFFSDAHVIEDPDAGIGAMVLVCALILTIPFGSFSFLNDSYFSGLKGAIDACDGMVSASNESFSTVHNRMTKSMTACLFFSMMGLIISSVYFVFKPLPGKEMDRWCRSQGRVLIGSLFLVTSLAIAGLMALGVYALKYVAVQNVNVCHDDVSSLFVPGVTGIVVSFFVALCCMW